MKFCASISATSPSCKPLGAIIGVLDVLFEWNIDWDNAASINFIGIPAGLLACWGFYKLLQWRWEKIVVVKDEIQDIGKSMDEQ